MKNSLLNCVLFFNFVGGCALKRALTFPKTVYVFVKNNNKKSVKKRVKKTLRKLSKSQMTFFVPVSVGPSVPHPLALSAATGPGGAGAAQCRWRLARPSAAPGTAVGEAGRVRRWAHPRWEVPRG